jgi:hypothetical protein
VNEAGNGRGADGGDTSTVVAVLLASAAVVAAVIGFRAALLGDSGSDTFHTAVREDVKRGAGIVEDSRFVYSEQAPAALEIASERIQAEETREEAKQADPGIRGFVENEAGMHEGIIGVKLEASAIASDPKYEEGDGFDGSRKATMLVAATIPAGLAFLFGALAQGFPARRRLFVFAGFASVAVAVIAALLIEVLA